MLLSAVSLCATGDLNPGDLVLMKLHDYWPGRIVEEKNGGYVVEYLEYGGSYEDLKPEQIIPLKYEYSLGEWALTDWTNRLPVRGSGFPAGRFSGTKAIRPGAILPSRINSGRWKSLKPVAISISVFLCPKGMSGGKTHRNSSAINPYQAAAPANNHQGPLQTNLTPEWVKKKVFDISLPALPMDMVFS